MFSSASDACCCHFCTSADSPASCVDTLASSSLSALVSFSAAALALFSLLASALALSASFDKAAAFFSPSAALASAGARAACALASCSRRRSSSFDALRAFSASCCRAPSCASQVLSAFSASALAFSALLASATFCSRAERALFREAMSASFLTRSALRSPFCAWRVLLVLESSAALRFASANFSWSAWFSRAARLCASVISFNFLADPSIVSLSLAISSSRLGPPDARPTPRYWKTKRRAPTTTTT
mmetsp:Transcript_24970/g.58966  ORF Transcript_24970/g.58966 Transcript_24970/m.58966 type:complete len:247 (-) Transcript_24970:123-863(-)